MATSHNFITTRSALHGNSSVIVPTITSLPVVFTTSTNLISSPGGTIAGALLLSISFFLGVPGNLFVIWSIVARTRRHTVTTLLILNIACADGFIMVLTPFFITYLIKRGWIFGLPLCKVLYYFCCANMYASIFLITLMSVHRLVAVRWPHSAGTIVGYRRMVHVTAVLWILALVLAVPVLVFRNLSRMLNKTTELYTQVCDCTHSAPAFAVMQYSTETLMGFLLPYSLILVSYMSILRRIRQTRFQKRIRTEKLILAIVVTFGVLWLPYHIVNMIQVAEALTQENKIKLMRTSLRPFAAALAFISSCVNPILYMFAGKSYIRRAGVAFMARFFETTGRDSSSRKTLRSSQNCQSKVQQEEEVEKLRRKESDTSISDNSSSLSKKHSTHVQNENECL